MTELIWISDWQIQCCGDEFAVGDEVSWPVLPAVVQESGLFSETELASSLISSYEAHEDEPLPHVSGTVRVIRTVGCRYAPGPPSDRSTLSPVPGTTVMEPVAAIEKWFGTDFDPRVLRFCGWLVDLEATAQPSSQGAAIGK